MPLEMMTARTPDTPGPMQCAQALLEISRRFPWQRMIVAPLSAASIAANSGGPRCTGKQCARHLRVAAKPQWPTPAFQLAIAN